MDDARQQLSQSLAASERTVKDLEQKLADASVATAQKVERQKAEYAQMRSALDGARRENEQVKHRLSASSEDFKRQVAALEQKVSALNAEKQSMAAQLQTDRDASQKAIAAAAEESRAVAMQRNAAIAQLEAESARQIEELAAVEREFANARTDRESLVRQRDELSRRINRITDEHKRLLDDLSDPGETDVPQRSLRPPPVRPHVIEVPDTNLFRPESERVINLPPARPVNVAPPKVRKA